MNGLFNCFSSNKPEIFNNCNFSSLVNFLITNNFIGHVLVDFLIDILDIYFKPKKVLKNFIRENMK